MTAGRQSVETIDGTVNLYLSELTSDVGGGAA